MKNYNSHCPFCIEFEGEEKSVLDEALDIEIESRVLRRTENLLAFPPLGQFVEGSLLISSDKHFISMSHLPKKYYQELERFIDKIKKLVTKYYQSPIIFEHGPMKDSSKGKCCVDHAHLNVFPVKSDIHNILKENFGFSRIDNMRELVKWRKKKQPYIFLQDNEQNRFVYEVGVLPSQYIRKIIAKELNDYDKWNWSDYLGEKEFWATIDKYKRSDSYE